MNTKTLILLAGILVLIVLFARAKPKPAVITPPSTLEPTPPAWWKPPVEDLTVFPGGIIRMQQGQGRQIPPGESFVLAEGGL